MFDAAQAVFFVKKLNFHYKPEYSLFISDLELGRRVQITGVVKHFRSYTRIFIEFYSVYFSQNKPSHWLKFNMLRSANGSSAVRT